MTELQKGKIKARLAKLFIDLVQIDSPSGQESRVCAYLLDYCQTEKWVCRQDAKGNLFVNVPGNGEPIILCAHMDTVQPGQNVQVVFENGQFRSNGNTILGADCKAGIAEILVAVEWAKNQGLQLRPLELIFTVEEESGLHGAFAVDAKQLQSREAVILDLGRQPLTICLSSPFIGLVNATFRGKRAHAGVEPEKGRNAIVAASAGISQVEWGRLNEATTCNIGAIIGGSRSLVDDQEQVQTQGVSNSVPDLVKLVAEARCSNKAMLEFLLRSIQSSFEKAAQNHGCLCEFEANIGCPGYKLETEDELVASLTATAQSLNIPVHYEHSGGASDANALVGKGIKAVVISYGGSNVHCLDETIHIDEMFTLVQFLLTFLAQK